MATPTQGIITEEVSTADEFMPIKSVFRKESAGYYEKDDESTLSLADANETLIDHEIQRMGPPVKYRSPKRETIQEWWIGHVTQIYNEEGYFVAELKDLKRIKSIAEFDIDTVFDDPSDRELYLFSGSEFAFYVITAHGSGRPITKTGIEFNSPYIWQKNDEEKAKDLFRELFPDDPPLEG